MIQQIENGFRAQTAEDLAEVNLAIEEARASLSALEARRAELTNTAESRFERKDPNGEAADGLDKMLLDMAKLTAPCAVDPAGPVELSTMNFTGAEADQDWDGLG